MKIRYRIILMIMFLMILSGTVFILVWYNSSKKMSYTYMNKITESTMRDTNNTLKYLIKDTDYLATLIAANEKNIIEPVLNLREYGNEIKQKAGKKRDRSYLKYKRAILDYTRRIRRYKYYIVGSAVAVAEDNFVTATRILPDEVSLYRDFEKLDQEKLKSSVVLMEPFYIESEKTNLSSKYIVPVVKGIEDEEGDIIGYAILYCDYGVIEEIFKSNLPEGSYFQVVNKDNTIIFSNYNGRYNLDDLDGEYVVNTFRAEQTDWTFTMAVPDAFYMSGIQRSADFIVFVEIAVIICAVLLAAFLVSHITVEINVLKDSMSKASKGDLMVRYERKNRDEIGQMGNTFNRMVMNLQEWMDKAAGEEKEKNINKMAFLQAQINPHFISNVLNNVVWMAKMQHAENIASLVNALSALLQNVMHQEKDMISLESELDYVDNYVKIMEYSGSYDFIVDKKLEKGTEKLMIPRFILQPILENAIYYGLPVDLTRQGCIKLQSEIVEEGLQLVVEDNGNGMTEVQIQKIMNGENGNRQSFTGIGIPNVNERIHLFYGEEYGIRYESRLGEYTRAIILLPIVYEENDR